MRTVLVLTAVIGMALALVSDQAQARGDQERRTGAVAGVVTVGDRVVPGATVVLVRVEGDRRWRERTRTDRRGHFGFRHVPVGRYVIKAFHDRAGRDRKRIGVRAGHVTRVRLDLH